jgi:hypothetical protein
MLARSRFLDLPTGARLETPLLIPSFSSRGFAFRPDGLSEVATHLEVTRDYLAEAILVSAYDIHHGMLQETRELLSPDHWDTTWAIPQLLVIDSGGYELGTGWSGSELRHDEPDPLPFTRLDYENLLDRLPIDRDLLVVTWDHLPLSEQRGDFACQIQDAESFSVSRPHLMVDVLLKPPAGSTLIQPADLRPHVELLRFAHVVGVTEKELGHTIIERASTLASLRRMLDSQGVAAPIHVFGALDPLVVTLYFAVGAELFDGLSWLRYGIYEGIGTYRDAAAILHGDYESPEDVRRATGQLRYLAALSEQKRALRRFAASNGDFATLGPHATAIERAFHLTVGNPQKEE